MAVSSRFMRTLFGGYEPRYLTPDLGLTAVRLFTGLSLALAAGWGKITDPAMPPSLPAAVGFPEILHFPLGWAAALSEFVGGLLLALGLLTRPAAFLILITMSVATYFHMAVQGDPFASDPTKGEVGYHLALFYAILALQFVLTGAGRFSIDHLVRSRG